MPTAMPPTKNKPPPKTAQDTDKPRRATMKNARAIAWIGVAISLAATLGGGWSLANRIAEFNKNNPHQAPYFLPINTTEFDYLGRHVSIADDIDDQGHGQVRVEYADDIAAIPVGVPNTYELPGLARHTDWLGVYLVGEPQGRDYEQYKAAVDAREITPRLVFVSRHLNPGVENSAFNFDIDRDSREYGETMRKRWTFGFLELLPEGGFHQWTRKYPESQRAFEGRTQAAILKGEPPPTRSPDELAEDTWEWYAAMQVIPAGKAPNTSFRNSALSNSGWSFPIAAVGVLGMIVCLAWALIPSKISRWTEEEKSA